MSVLKLHRLILATLMAFAMSVAFSGCSSSEESSESADASQEACPGDGPRGADGVCCDFDQGQEGCPLMEN
jgi:hypothetical protein